MVKDINLSGGSNPAGFVAHGDEVLFVANDGSGKELWKTDGTEAGTQQVTDIAANPDSLVSLNQAIYFVAEDSNGDEQLWVTNDSSQGATMLRETFPSAPENPSNLAVLGNSLFFQGSDDLHGEEIWALKTVQSAEVEDVSTGPSSYTGPVVQTSQISGSAGSEVVIAGSGLGEVRSVRIGGVEISNLEFDPQTGELKLMLPQGLSKGLQDLELVGSFGTLLLQGLIQIIAPGDDAPPSYWTKLSEDRLSAKFYAKNVIDAGKVQFMFDGEEMAWIRAIDSSDPKLRNANDAYYFVRTVELLPGQKNVLEIYVDGERVRRAAYAG
jgi:ELWxxDGT repeat protein